jgi:hypothetical protein
MRQFLISHGFELRDQDGRLLPAEDLHNRGAGLMSALLELEQVNPDMTDSTTHTDAELGVVVVELLVTAANEAAALAAFMNVARTAVHMTGGSTRHWSEPGVSPSRPNVDYHPDKLTLAHP